MSAIAIEVAVRSAPASFIMAIHKRTNSSISEIAENLRTSQPIYDREILGNNFEQEFELVRDLIKEMEKAEIQFVIKEDGCEITKAALENIILSFESILDEIRELDELGHS